VAISTGSTTRFGSRPARSAITAATSGSPTMPTLTAATGRSDNTASIWAATMSAGTWWIAVTPSVFWAVTAVSTDAP
jgi:hypothetical protein